MWNDCAARLADTSALKSCCCASTGAPQRCEQRATSLAQQVRAPHRREAGLPVQPPAAALSAAVRLCIRAATPGPCLVRRSRSRAARAWSSAALQQRLRPPPPELRSPQPHAARAHRRRTAPPCRPARNWERRSALRCAASPGWLPPDRSRGGTQTVSPPSAGGTTAQSRWCAAALPLRRGLCLACKCDAHFLSAVRR